MEVKRVSKGLFLGGYIASFVGGMLLFFAGGVGLGIGGAVASENADAEAAGAVIAIAGGLLLFIGGLVLLFGTVLWCILIYKMWASIQDGGFARSTPGKAVGFLFIPFFNLYWIFQALWGFSKDYNSMVEAQGVNVEKLPEGLFLAACILPLCGMIPFVNWLASLANVVVMIICVNYICNAINALADAGPVQDELDQLQV